MWLSSTVHSSFHGCTRKLHCVVECPQLTPALLHSKQVGRFPTFRSSNHSMCRTVLSRYPWCSQMGPLSTMSMRITLREGNVIAHSWRRRPPSTLLTGRGMQGVRPGKTISHFRNSRKAISSFRSHFLAHLLQHANALLGSTLQEAWQTDSHLP